MDWRIIVGLCAAIMLLYFVAWYLAHTSKAAEGAGSRNRAIVVFACFSAIFAILLDFGYILYIENKSILSFAIVIIFVIPSAAFMFRIILQDIQKYSKTLTSVT